MLKKELDVFFKCMLTKEKKFQKFILENTLLGKVLTSELNSSLNGTWKIRRKLDGKMRPALPIRLWYPKEEARQHLGRETYLVDQLRIVIRNPFKGGTAKSS